METSVRGFVLWKGFERLLTGCALTSFRYEQSGFVKGRPTEDMINRLFEIVLTYTIISNSIQVSSDNFGGLTY